MAKESTIKGTKRQNYDPIVPILASKHGLSPRQIRLIRDGERSNSAVFADYMFLLEWWKTGVKNLDNPLLRSVNELVPFN